MDVSAHTQVYIPGPLSTCTFWRYFSGTLVVLSSVVSDRGMEKMAQGTIALSGLSKLVSTATRVDLTSPGILPQKGFAAHQS